MSTFETLYLMIAFATLIVMMLKYCFPDMKKAA